MVADRGVVRQSRPLRWRATARPADLDELRAAKRGRRISAVLPARNEGPTVGAIVAAIVALDPLVDEVV
ncbi:MAG: hypothetical protein ACRD0M_01135, partial [Acidimicrobiales bacterium]